MAPPRPHIYFASSSPTPSPPSTSCKPLPCQWVSSDGALTWSLLRTLNKSEEHRRFLWPRASDPKISRAPGSYTKAQAAVEIATKIFSDLPMYREHVAANPAYYGASVEGKLRELRARYKELGPKVKTVEGSVVVFGVLNTILTATKPYFFILRELNGDLKSKEKVKAETPEFESESDPGSESQITVKSPISHSRVKPSKIRADSVYSKLPEESSYQTNTEELRDQELTSKELETRREASSSEYTETEETRGEKTSDGCTWAGKSQTKYARNDHAGIEYSRNDKANNKYPNSMENWNPQATRTSHGRRIKGIGNWEEEPLNRTKSGFEGRLCEQQTEGDLIGEGRESIDKDDSYIHENGQSQEVGTPGAKYTNLEQAPSDTSSQFMTCSPSTTNTADTNSITTLSTRSFKQYCPSKGKSKAVEVDPELGEWLRYRHRYERMSRKQDRQGLKQHLRRMERKRKHERYMIDAQLRLAQINKEAIIEDKGS